MLIYQQNDIQIKNKTSKTKEQKLSKKAVHNNIKMLGKTQGQRTKSINEDSISLLLLGTVGCHF